MTRSRFICAASLPTGPAATTGGDAPKALRLQPFRQGQMIAWQPISEAGILSGMNGDGTRPVPEAEPGRVR
jgi:hypothetical protein